MTRIEDYFLIGDLHTAALVSKQGAIDWLCLPTFESPSVFGAVLDADKGGSCRVELEGWTTGAAYVADTAIVETQFRRGDAAFRLRDFMLPRPTEEAVPHVLVRKVRGERGQSTVTFLVDPRPDYARMGAACQGEKSPYAFPMGDRTLWVHVPRGARTSCGPNGLRVEVDIAEGEEKRLVLEYAVEARWHLTDRNLEDETIRFWREWLSHGQFFPLHEAQLKRSAITLKLMQFYPTGGLVAAPTTSLPEEIGGVRNWDYRYVWIRDATFTLYALSVLGFRQEATKFFRYIERIAEDAKRRVGDEWEFPLAIMYTIWGQPLQGETTLDHLAGYEDSKPVRIGNGAGTQFQLDMYGSLIDAYAFMSRVGVDISDAGKEVIRLLVKAIERNWQKEDSGIWEVRGGDKHFSYSKLMAWVGVDRALRLGEEIGITPQERDRWESLREQIEAWIWEHCWDDARKTFKQHPDTDAQDASNYLFVLQAFVSRTDDRAKALIAETRRELAQKDLYVYRYHSHDGLAGGEGAFILCSFWQVAALAAVGESEEATRLMDGLMALVPQSGLIAEEYDPEHQRFLGNHPQAFSHIGLILAAYYLHRHCHVGTKETLSMTGVKVGER